MPSELRPGVKAPAFALPRDGGGTISLADFAGHKLVLYFFPRADTPDCTKEAIDFSRLKAAFGKAGTEILGVSADPVPAQDKFKAKHKLGLRRNAPHARGLWSLAGEVHVREEVHGRRARNFPHRSRPTDCPDLAKGLGGGTRGRSAGGRKGPLVPQPT